MPTHPTPPHHPPSPPTIRTAPPHHPSHTPPPPPPPPLPWTPCELCWNAKNAPRIFIFKSSWVAAGAQNGPPASSFQKGIAVVLDLNVTKTITLFRWSLVPIRTCTYIYIYMYTCGFWGLSFTTAADMRGVPCFANVNLPSVAYMYLPQG